MKIEITDVTARDGLQSIGMPIPTEDKVAIIERSVAAGARRVEVTSFVSPRAIPQLADAEQVVQSLDIPDDILLRALVPNMRGAERAARTRIDEWVCFLSATESHSKANSNCTIDESLGRLEPVVSLAQSENRKAGAALAVAFGCPFEGITPERTVVSIAQHLFSMGFSELTLGDTIGTATPSQVSSLVRALSAAVPELGIVLHLHDTRGLSLANVLAGLGTGVDRYEASIGGIGGCPFAPGATGNVALEDLVHFLHAEGHQTGFDLSRLVSAGHELEKLLDRKLPAKLLRVPPVGFTVPLDGVERAVG